MKVVRLNANTFPVNDYEASVWRQHHIEPILVEANTPDAIIPAVADCDGLVVVATALPMPVVESLKKCRVISRRGAGTDKIDVTTATRMGIVVTNVPFFCIEEQADHTMMLLLSLLRRLPQMMRGMRAGTWHGTRRLSEMNQRIAGLTLGLVGFGHTAQAVARRAQGFGLRVLATRQNLTRTEEADALGVTLVDLDKLLRESDFVSLHLPLNASTVHMLDDAALRKMKPGARLINTSRGALVDEAALATMLRERRLGGAGLDTFENINVFAEHEAPPDHPLVDLLAEEDVTLILTPHVAAGSAQAMQDVSRGAIENLATILTGHWPCADNIVNKGVTPRAPLKL